MSRPAGHVLCLDPCSGLSDLPVERVVLVQHPRTDTGSSCPYWGKKEHTTSLPVPPMTGTEVSRGLGIPAYADNLVSDVWAVGNGNISSVLTGWEPWSGLGPNSRGLVLETLEEQKSSTSSPN